MYPFALCKKAEKHPGKQGQFMIGVKKVAESEVAVLMDMLGDLPMTHIFQEDGLGLFQQMSVSGISIHRKRQSKIS